MTITWITSAGAITSTITERVTISLPISASSSVGPVTFTLIAGRLPRGLRISGNIEIQDDITTGFVKGSPAEVRKFTESKFVIRADDGIDLEDRTFSISIDGADDPEWITKEGFLNVGPANAFFVLDNSYVNYQLEAYDSDLTAGEQLEFFLMPFGGQLPPGLTLSKDGIISGFTDPIFALEYFEENNGGFDQGSYDTSPLDFARKSTLGYDSFLYDSFDYDFKEIPVVPRRLSRIYTFAVGINDGLTISTRVFKIYVVTEEFLKADNTLVQVDTNVFTADSNDKRTPIWITNSDLGKFRANNYVTIYLDIYDPPTLPGYIVYFLLRTNPGTYKLKSTGEIINTGRYEISGELPIFPNSKINTTNSSQWEVIDPETFSEIPPGLELDSTTGELAGRVPYQNRVSRRYTFTMRAVDFTTPLISDDYVLIGDWNSSTIYQPNQAVKFNGLIYLCLVQNKNNLPSENTDFWISGTSTADKTFTVEVIGEIESGIKWITGNDLGTIKPNRTSDLFVQAESQLYGGRVVYDIVSGQLPPGLTLLPNGLIVGKVRQFAEGTDLGLIRFYDIINGEKNFSITFDDNTTTFDKIYRFTILARDTAFAAENFRDFYIKIIAETNKTFANLWVKAFQNVEKRIDWFDFISDISIFDPKKLYRYGDPNYGVQNEIKMLIFSGIESVEAEKFVQAMSRNHYRKRFLFGDVKMAKAKDPETQETIYEVIYVNIIDEYEKNGISISPTLDLRDDINSKILISYDSITVDSDIPFVSDSDHQRIFPNSVKNMRNRIRELGERDRDFLPLWMRSIQDQAEHELGYTKALILCYAKPEKSSEIIAKIKASGFDFKNINFLADRYIIDAIDGEIKDKYLIFPQHGEKKP